MSRKRVYLTPTPVRIWHWVNALAILTLILSGLQIRYPDSVALFDSYRTAVRLHNTAGLTAIVFFAVWLLYYALVAHKLVRLYVPSPDDLTQGMWAQVRYYAWDYFKGRPSPHRITPDSKFNPLQKAAYLVIMFLCMPLVIGTGLLLLDVHTLDPLVQRLGGVRIVAGLHVVTACIFGAFVCTHIYLSTLGAHIRTMWTGWEEHLPEDDSLSSKQE